MELPPDAPPPYEQVMQQKLAKCGLATAGITVTYENDLQGYAIMIGVTAGASVEKFECIREASDDEFVNFIDAGQGKQYQDFLTAQSRPNVIKWAEAELARQGRLKGFPRRTSYATDEQFGGAIEAHCGLPKGSAIRRFRGVMAFQPPTSAIQNVRTFGKKYGCLMSAMALAGARQELDIAFIGNEAVTPEK